MQGYVLAFRPATGEGTIVTDSGEAIRFAGANHYGDLQGGDIVTFHVRAGQVSGPRPDVNEIEIVQKWSDRLTADDRPLLRDLYNTLEIGEPVH